MPVDPLGSIDGLKNRASLRGPDATPSSASGLSEARVAGLGASSSASSVERTSQVRERSGADGVQLSDELAEESQATSSLSSCPAADHLQALRDASASLSSQGGSEVAQVEKGPGLHPGGVMTPQGWQSETPGMHTGFVRTSGDT